MIRFTSEFNWYKMKISAYDAIMETKEQSATNNRNESKMNEPCPWNCLSPHS